MKIFSFLGQRQRPLDWSYTSGGKIWRMLFSETGRIVGESRNQDRKQASFFCVDEKTGEMLWENLTLSEPWWVGMEAVQKGVLLLHEFAQPDLPEHKGIRAFDVESGRPLWQNTELTHWFGYQNSVYAFKTLFERRVGYSLDLHTGEILQEHDESFRDLDAVKKLALEEQQQEDYRFPEVFDPQTASPRIVEAIKKIARHDRVTGNIEFVQEKEYLLFNYHTSGRTSTVDSVSLENHLEIIEVDKNQKIFSELLVRGARAPVPDSFFVKGDFVYFIKDEHILSALRLWKS